MSILHDTLSTSSVSLKDVHNHIKKDILANVINVKTRNPKKPLSEISEDLDVSQSAIRNYIKEASDYPIKQRHRNLTQTQKYQMQIKLQTGKLTKEYERGKISKEEYESRMSSVRDKYNDLIRTTSDADVTMTAATSRTKKTISAVDSRRSPRGGTIDDEATSEAANLEQVQNVFDAMTKRKHN